MIALCSEGPTFRRSNVQRVLCLENICSEGPMFRWSHIQKIICSENPMFRNICSEGPIYSEGPTCFLFFLSAPMNHMRYVARYKCFNTYLILNT